MNLHSYWDTGVVQNLGEDPQAAAETLLARHHAREQGRRGRKVIRGHGRWKDSTIAKNVAYTIGLEARMRSGLLTPQPAARL